MKEWLIGVDEAGRAPLAGPVCVGAVIADKNFDIAVHFPGVRDSKLLSEKKREEIYELLLLRKQKGDVRFCVRMTDPEKIDALGLTRAVRSAIYRCVKSLAPSPEGVRVLLDGLLFAPSIYKQQTIIHGDLLVPIISLASIAAKVERDRLMKRMSKKYPDYGFEQHKGYPTKMHYEQITKNGLCDIHRRSFCRNIAGVV